MISFLGLIIGLIALLVAVVPPASAFTVLSPPGNGIPIFSSNKSIKSLNRELITAMTDNLFFVRQRKLLKIIGNPRQKKYESTFLMPDKAFESMCTLSVEKGIIKITAGNIEIAVFPNAAEIYQDGKLLETVKSKNVRGVGFERGYGLDSKMVSLARVYTNDNDVGSYIRLVLPAQISITVVPNTVGEIGEWVWVRGKL